MACGRYTAPADPEGAPHDDILTFTIQLTTPDEEVAWAARVFLILNADGLIREDYHLTIKPLAA